MRITIDTQKDSHEEIRKAIKMLSALVGVQQEIGESSSRNIFDDPSPSPIGNLFDDTQSQQQSSPSSNVFGNLFDSPATPTTSEKKDDSGEDYSNAPSVQEYF